MRPPPAQCLANAAAVGVAWDEAHEAWREGLCDSPAGRVIVQCVTPLNHPPQPE